VCGDGLGRVVGGQELVACSEGCSLTSEWEGGWKLSVFDRLTVPTVMPLLIKSTPVAR
jgi:hypothetical protein